MKKIKTVTQAMFLAAIVAASVLTSSVAKAPAQTEVQKEKKPETKRFAAIMMLQKTSITSGAHQDLTE